MAQLEEARRTWERRVDWPLTGIAVAFLVAYAWPILDQNLSDGWRTFCNGVTWATWAVFAIDYAMRWYLSQDRRAFVRTNLLDLVVLALPLLRPLRMLRLITLLDRISRGSAATSLRGRIAVYVFGGAGLIVLCASLAMLDAERNATDANIRTFGDALWWAATTVTTVGYGDRYPTTGEGRLVAGLLMLGGIALLGVVTATLASWILDRVRQVEEQAQMATRHDVQQLARQIAELRSELTNLRSERTGD